MRDVVNYGCAISESVSIGCCAMVFVDFIFHVRSVSMTHIRCQDITMNDNGITIALFSRKDSSTLRPLLLKYGRNKEWPPLNPITLIQRWN